MASVAKWRDDNNGTLVTSGTTAAFTVTTNQVEASLVSGYTVAIAFHATADTSATLAVDGLTAKPLQVTPGTNLIGGEFTGGNIGSFTYSSTGTGQWIANRAPPVIGTGSIAASAVTAAKIATGAITLPKYATTAGNPGFGFDMPVNLGLASSVSSGVLTISLKTNAGADPSATDPVYIPFRHATIATGTPVWITVSSALSIDTNAVGATLGSTQANVPFRFRITSFNNAGTAVMALWHSGAASGTPVIKPFDETTLQNTTAFSGSATSAGVFYTPNGTTLSSCAFRDLGFLEYSAGLATPGTYAGGPTKLQLAGPGVKKPGDIIQATSLTSSSCAITPSSVCNLIQVWASGGLNVANAQAGVTATIKRSSTTLATIGETFLNSAIQMIAGVSCSVIDSPQTTAATTYSLGTAGTGFVGPTMMLQELMG
jgi:hypothetical protein